MAVADAEIETWRRRAVEIASRITGRAALVSAAAYWPHKLNDADLAEARAAEAENDSDAAALRALVAGGLAAHRAAMCAWAELAASSDAVSETYARGWRQVLEAWSAGEPEPDEPITALAWLIERWHAAIEDGA